MTWTINILAIAVRSLAAVVSACHSCGRRSDAESFKDCSGKTLTALTGYGDLHGLWFRKRTLIFRTFCLIADTRHQAS
jgi:hypothetical protein